MPKLPGCAIHTQAFALAIVLSLSPVSRAVAQSTTDAVPIRGVVRDRDGHGLEGANVFVIETLDGFVTKADGRFEIAVTFTGTVTLAARRLGYTEVRRRIDASERDSIVIMLAASSVTLAPVTVRPGEYTASEERGATLTPLEVVTTPGTAADVNRAIQALPGVQAVDEGSGLFVRGGDHTETKVFLNDAVMLNPLQLLSPSGTFVGSVDPFLLDRIFFSSGGFGARYGDALSGVVALHTLGRPPRTDLTAGAGLAALSASAAVNVSSSLGVRAAANRFDLGPVIALNGSPQEFDPAPRGYDASASVVWNYRGAGEVKAFAIRQTSALGLGVDDASFSGHFNVDLASDLVVVSWTDHVGGLRPAASLSRTTLDRSEEYGAFRLRTRIRRQQLFIQQAWSLSTALTLGSGGELERALTGYLGTIPTSGDDLSPDARTRVIGAGRGGDRIGAFVEADWRAGPRTRLVAGVRGDRSSLTRLTTVDPRLSAAYSPLGGVTLTAAWGVYHQVPDPLDHEDALAAGEDRLPPMRARQGVIGVQIGSDVQLVRVEVHAKRFDDLALRTRDHEVVSGGSGYARGVDLFVRGGLPFGFRVRYAMSHVKAERTDPHSGSIARSPFDIRFSHTAVVERHFGMHWTIATAYRAATGRPFTPITGATFDDDRDIYTAEYGAPMGERLPDFRRLDLSVSWFGRITPAWQAVFYVTLTNALDRTNVQAYRYSPDYTRRTPVQSVFNRSIYFGTTITRFLE